MSDTNYYFGILDKPFVARMVTHLRIPLFRNGYALVLSSAITSGLGMLYWILAARFYTAEVVGLNSAILSTMVFLANLAQLNLVNALNRFIPTAGQFTRKFIITTYGISVGGALIASLVFISGVTWWSPTLSVFFNETPSMIRWFVFATMGWCVFVLQDSVLTGLREASWVPLENLLFSITKIGLLLLFSTMLAAIGVFASWTMPLLVLILLVNWFIFRRLIPKHVARTKVQARPIVPAEIARFVAGDYVASLAWMTTTNLLPVLVLEMAGAEANAYFYLAWTIAYSLYLVSRNMGMSLITEAAADETKLYSFSYRVGIQNGRILLPTVGLIVLGAPLILRLFGSDYANAGSGLLRLLALSALPNIVTALYISMLRVQRRMKRLFLLLLLLSGIVVSLSYILLPRLGITGIGVAWLVAQTAVALVLLATELRPVWLPNLNTRLILRVLSVLLKPRQWVQEYRQRVVIESALAQIKLPNWAEQPRQVHRLMDTEGDIAVALIGIDERVTAVFKVAMSELADNALQQQVNRLSLLQEDVRLGAWRQMLPGVKQELMVNGRVCILETFIPGIELRHRLVDPAERDHALETAVAGIRPLHQLTSKTITVDHLLLHQWIDTPCQQIHQLFIDHPLAAAYHHAIDSMQEEFHQALSGKELGLSWTHGDYSPNNILILPDGSSLTGIIDWELATPDNLPFLDVVHLILSTRMLVQNLELGDIVCALLANPDWSVMEKNLLQEAALYSHLTDRQLVLFTWLSHIQANLSKAKRFSQSAVWIAKNVEAVLRLIGQEDVER
jgi:O-antigen/teichoic acid export membrane protein/thiamine kinase-like enzyme